MKLHKLKRAAFHGVTIVCADAEQVIQFNGLAHCGVDIGDAFVIGLSSAWRGKYWVLEHSTGIIYWTGSLSDAREWMKLCLLTSSKGK